MTTNSSRKLQELSSSLLVHVSHLHTSSEPCSCRLNDRMPYKSHSSVSGGRLISTIHPPETGMLQRIVEPSSCCEVTFPPTPISSSRPIRRCLDPTTLVPMIPLVEKPSPVQERTPQSIAQLERLWHSYCQYALGKHDSEDRRTEKPLPECWARAHVEMTADLYRLLPHWELSQIYVQELSKASNNGVFTPPQWGHCGHLPACDPLDAGSTTWLFACGGIDTTDGIDGNGSRRELFLMVSFKLSFLCRQGKK